MKVLLTMLMMLATLLAKSPLQELQSNTTHFALLNADIAHDARENRLPNLTALLALYPKVITLVVRKDSNITRFEDIQTNNFQILYDAKEENSIEHLLKTFQLKHTGTYHNWHELEALFETKKVDAFITLIGHPNAQLAQFLKETNATLISLIGKKFDQLNQDSPYCLKSGIPKGMYHLKKDIKSIATKYLLVTTADENSSEVGEIVSGIIKYRKILKTSDPLLRSLSIKHMLENLAIPQHKAAIKAFNQH